MISYAEEKSPYYDNHKDYCNRIEQYAQKHQADCSGFCNSFGYEVKLELTDGTHRCEVRFIKSQSTQNGVIIPVDSLEYQGLEFTSTAQTGNLHVSYGRSAIKRVLMKSAYKDKIPETQFLFLKPEVSDAVSDAILEVVNELGSDSMQVENGSVQIKRHMTAAEPETVMNALMGMVKKLESVAAV